MWRVNERLSIAGHAQGVAFSHPNLLVSKFGPRISIWALQHGETKEGVAEAASSAKID